MTSWSISWVKAWDAVSLFLPYEMIYLSLTLTLHFYLLVNQFSETFLSQV